MMPTSIPRICKLKQSSSGFTFIEIMVVLVLMSITMSLAIPQITSFAEDPWQSEFGNLVRVFKLLRNESILGHRDYHIVFDVKEQQYYVEVGLKSGRFEKLESPKILKPHTFPESFALQQVSLTGDINSQSASRVLKQPVAVRIDSSGFVTPFTLVFVDTEANSFWKIATTNIMGQLELKQE
ncbi:MAG: prepilin-type N-terminal cleavage/methylation domain-containing protein [SAR324 cluster bacterium]|nr:prepilin-type N-terminal cleavage/methylation domain-containing protein [SAR324 cluster bacterium]